MNAADETVVDLDIVPGAPWAFIAIMGVTGAGKSTFIRTASGDESVVVGDGLKSCTSELRGYSFHCGGYNVNLIDSPGFNDTYRSETEVLQDIASWLRDTYKADTKLTGIIYLHSISQPRMEGSALRNLKMFRELCGTSSQERLARDNFWGEVDANTARSREEELRATPEFWGSMLRKGSSMDRFTDATSAIKIIRRLLGRTPVPLKIQRELVEDDKSLIDTAAGQIVNEELVRLESKHLEEKQEMQKEMAEALEKHDIEMQEILGEQQKKVEESLERIQRQQEQLKADRRADRRKLQLEFESQLHELKAHNTELQQQYNEEANRRYANLSLDEVISKVRAEESKLRSEERDALEVDIAKLKAKPPHTWKDTAKTAGMVLLKAAQLVLPIASLITLGVPISL